MPQKPSRPAPKQTGPKPLAEATPLVAEALPGAEGVRMVQFITPGWGSSGYYSAEVLKEAADAGLFAAGTHMHLDHATSSGRRDQPERSVKDIGAVLTENGTWDETRQAVVGPVKYLAPHAELVEALAPYIGVSISGSATDITIGQVEGRSGPIVEGLHSIDSVDFVTHAGRGGKVLVESARPSTVNALAIAHGIDEATVNDVRNALTDLVRTAYSGDKTYVWVRDFDETTVWFEVESPDLSGIYGQAYDADDNGPTALTGRPVEVRIVTTYAPKTTAPTPDATETSANPLNVPATRPDGTTTNESQEELMGKIQIEESEHSSLIEKAGRVDALETENASLKAENGTLKESAAVRDRRDRASEIIAERAKDGGVTFTALEHAGLVAGLPLKEGQLDEAAFTTTVDKHIAERKAATGTGTVRGFGNGGIVTPVGESGPSLSDLDAALGIKEA